MQQDPLNASKSDFSIDGRKLLDILRRRPLLIGISTVLAPLAAFLYLSRQAPTYQAQASLIIDSVTPQYLGSQFRDIVDVENNWWTSQEYLSTQLRIIQSHALARTVAQDLCQPPHDDKE